MMPAHDAHDPEGWAEVGAKKAEGPGVGEAPFRRNGNSDGIFARRLLPHRLPLRIRRDCCLYMHDLCEMGESNPRPMLGKHMFYH